MKALILAALSAIATFQGMHPHGLAGHLHARIAQKLELTAEQKDAAHRILQAHRPALRAKGQAAFQSRADVLQSVADPQSTEAQLREMEAKASAAALALELEANQVVKEIDPLLTDVQRAKARQMVADLRGHAEAFHAMAHGD